MADQLSQWQLQALIKQLRDAQQPQAPQADQSAFLRSEKDTRPYDETWQRHTFFPIGVNGYNNTPPGRSYGPAQPDRDTFPSLGLPGMVHDTIEGFKHFGDMIRGKSDVTYIDQDGRERPTPEAMGSVNALVGATMIGGGQATKPQGSAGVFAGREAAERLASTGERRPLEAMNLARVLKQQGKSADEIYGRTSNALDGTNYAGVHYSENGTPLFEISDHAARLTGNGGPTLGSALKHDELFKALPDMAGISYQEMPSRLQSSTLGDYRPSGWFTNERIRVRPGEATDVPLHETSHALDSRSGAQPTSNAGYWNREDEIRARSVQARQFLTPEERRARNPSIDFDAVRKAARDTMPFDGRKDIPIAPSTSAATAVEDAAVRESASSVMPRGYTSSTPVPDGINLGHNLGPSLSADDLRDMMARSGSRMKDAFDKANGGPGFDHPSLRSALNDDIHGVRMGAEGKLRTSFGDDLLLDGKSYKSLPKDRFGDPEPKYMAAEYMSRPGVQSLPEAQRLATVRDGMVRYDKEFGHETPVYKRAIEYIDSGKPLPAISSKTYGVPSAAGPEQLGSALDYVTKARELARRNIDFTSPFRPGQTLYSNSSKEGGAANVLASRELDKLGYYSQALEQAKSLPNKASPDQILSTLRNAGVKQGEIDATNLAKFLEGKPSVTRDDVVSYLRDNRVAPNETVRLSGMADARDYFARRQFGQPYDSLAPMDQMSVRRQIHQPESDAQDISPKWQQYSLSPTNPSYRESG